MSQPTADLYLNSKSIQTRLSAWLRRLEAMQPERIELGLDRIRQVLAKLALDLSHSRIITVAGTNGKGSVVAFLEAAYGLQGIDTLAYTSPHILRYNERIRINSVPVSDEQLVSAFEQVDQARESTDLTYFEFGTLAALVLLARHRPPVAILEVGLGGRLDAVNCIDPDVAVITSIGIDHTDWLGPDRSSIAYEKSGIMRAGRPLICGDPDPPVVIAEQAASCRALLYRYLEHFQFARSGGGFVSDWISSVLPVQGISWLAQHQRNNAATALAVITLPDTGLPDVSNAVINSGQWLQSPPARMQQLEESPAVYLDIAHNPQAAKALAIQLHNSTNGSQRTFAVLAMLADKDVIGVAAALDKLIDHWYLASTEGPRGLKAEELQKLVAKGAQASSTTVQSVMQALQQARTDADEGDRIIVLGTFANATALLSEPDMARIASTE